MKILSWVISGILILVIVALGFLYFSPDYDILLVKSQSMEPAIQIGDMVIVGPVGGPMTSGLWPGKIITYTKGKAFVTHRIVEVKEDCVITMGDALEEPDPAPVAISNIHGIYMFRIPYVGYFNSFVRTKKGWFLAIVMPACILLLLIVKDILKEAFSSEY